MKRAWLLAATGLLVGMVALAATARAQQSLVPTPSPAMAARPAAPPAAPAMPATVSKAVAQLRPGKDSKVEGMVTFAAAGGGVRVSGRITGLTPGPHGFHVHEFGDCSAADFTSAGGHFNPTAQAHGAPKDPAHHAGDFGNIEAGADGTATVDYTDPSGTFMGMRSVLGRAVVVHANPDDLKSQPAGNAGPRVACGVIGVAKPE